MNLKDILREEIIGLKMEVIDAKNRNLIGLKGVIVDETRNTIVMKDNKNKMKTLLKDQIVLKVEYKGNDVKIDGNLLIGRSEERLKK